MTCLFVYVDLVPENTPVALKMDIEGYECKVIIFYKVIGCLSTCMYARLDIEGYKCKVIIFYKVRGCLSAFICRDRGDIGLFIN